jgi:hypothetical protein
MSIITKEEIEKVRTFNELKLYIESSNKKINNNEIELRNARLKKGLYKEYREELIPLYIYMKLKYQNENYKARIIVGNQGYDGEIFNNGFIENVEICYPIYGKQQKERAKDINKEHFSFHQVFTNTNQIISLYLQNAKKKGLRDYSNMTLLFVISTLDCPPDSKNEINQFISKLRNELKIQRFSAKHVYLIVLPYKSSSGNDYKGELFEVQ